MTIRVLAIATVALLMLALGGTAFMLTARAPDPERPAIAAAPTPDRLSGQVRQGQVAFVVQLDPTVGSGSVIRAGDRVDVLAYFPTQVTGGGAVTRTLVRDAAVLVAGRQKDASVATVGVTAEQALLLQQAEQLGGRRFALLRSPQGPPASVMPETFTDHDLETWMARAAGGK